MKKQAVVFQKPEPKEDKITKTPLREGASEVNPEHENISSNSSEEAKEIQEQSEKFEKLVKRGERILLKIRTVFPFDLFPDTIVIDEAKITIIRRLFFYSSQIQTFPIQHIQDVEVESSIFFATLKILPMGFAVVGPTQTYVSVQYLWKHEAIQARRIIGGLLIGVKEGIDFGKVETPHFVEKVEQLGKVR